MTLFNLIIPNCVNLITLLENIKINIMDHLVRFGVISIKYVLTKNEHGCHPMIKY